MAHEASRCMLLGWLLWSQDILILVLVEALSLLLGLLNANVEEALMLKPGCVTHRFLLSIFLSPERRAFSYRSLANCLFSMV